MRSKDQKNRSKKRRKRPAKQLSLQSQGWGGRREGAGRPKSKDSGVSHLKRPEVKPSHPLHITVRLKSGLPSLRSKKTFELFQQAVIAAKEKGLRVIQFAVLGNHFHILAETQDNETLARGMLSLNIRIAKGLHRFSRTKAQGRAYTVLQDRFHMERLTTPTQVKNALVYIFANASKYFKRSCVFDWYSSFTVWEDPAPLRRCRRDLDWSRPRVSERLRVFFEECLSPPESWLARVGWLRAVG